RGECVLGDAVMGIEILEHVWMVEKGDQRPLAAHTAASSMSRASVLAESKYASARSRAARLWRAYRCSTSSTAAAASPGVEKDRTPLPVGSHSEKPVCSVTTGRPLARYAALRSLNQPVRANT